MRDKKFTSRIRRRPTTLGIESLEARQLMAADPLYRVNAGGAQLAGTPAWLADTATSPSQYTNAALADSQLFSTSTPIDVTHASIPAGTPMALFQTERWDKKVGNVPMQWNFPVSPGQYELRLYFAENFSGTQAVGARTFDVSVESQLVLNDYDVFAEVGAFKGVVKSFNVTADNSLDIVFGHVVNNPSIKAIEILPAPQAGQLVSSVSSLNFGNTIVNQSTAIQFTLSNNGQAGAPSITINPSQALFNPANGEFSVSFVSQSPIVLAPGQSTPVTATYTPGATGSDAAVLAIAHNGGNSPFNLTASGSGVTNLPIAFGKSTLAGIPLNDPTSLQFGPDGRLYVAQQDGVIKAITVTRTGANQYQATATETISLIQSIPNHDDNGALNTTITKRLVTGILVTGTAQNPVIYVCSSDPRIGGGNAGTDLNLDTNSGIVSRLTWTGSGWQKLDLVRGLPRSEENHHGNGMQLDVATQTLYLAYGGHTNMGATSNNFAFLPEYALSAAILSINLNAIGNTTYDLPTLDDETRAGVNDVNDPFGGNDGKNQARLVPGGPVQVHAPGFRNPYDLLIMQNGRMYTVDNGPNAGWGDVPINEGPQGLATNAQHEPGVSQGDGLEFITGPGYYGGHPNPTRSNPNNKFNASNPQSPVSVANPIESDYQVPGVDDQSLIVFAESTNGLAEYTANHFGGAMNGDMIIASFDNTIKRVKFNAAGDQVVLSENLFSNVGARPLDVIAVGNNGPFAGTIWVADHGADSIFVFEPAGGGGGTPGDSDGDGYSDSDEQANGTNPNSPGDVPPDWDTDFTSNLLDPDDDNDALLDTSDPFAIDASNGANTPIGTIHSWENDESAGGLLNLGFTGLMTNGSSNYASLFNPAELTAGGAAGVLTIDQAGSGTAKGSSTNQTQAFQFGVNVAGAVQPFKAETRILGPFSGLTPQAGQEMGLYIGTGNQSNFIQIVVRGNNGGEIQVGNEVNGTFQAVATSPLPVAGVGSVDLYLSFNPITKMTKASYAVDGGPRTNLLTLDLDGAISNSALAALSTMAVGVIATAPTGTLPVTWDFLGVTNDGAAVSNAEALVAIVPGANLDSGSTFKAGSFRITNNSPSGQKIQSIRYDINNAFLPDLVFDPNGTAGDPVGKPFTPDAGAAATGQSTHSYLSPHDGGFDSLLVNFTDFNPGETFTFSIDIDPTSVKGAPQPGPEHAGSVSGLELIGSTVTLTFSDGSVLVTEPYRMGTTLYASQSIAAGVLPGTPTISVAGVSASQAVVTSPGQTVRINGAPGATVQLLVVEGALLTATVPGGGFDLDPFEANKAIAVAESTATIGGAGFVDVPITLTRARTEAGLNYVMAVIKNSQGRTSLLSNVMVLKLEEEPPVGSEVVFRVNSGGAQVAGTPVWSIDTSAQPSPFTNAAAASSAIASTSLAVDMSHWSIPPGTPMSIFQNHRWDKKPGLIPMQWDFPVTPGNYEVRLYFAETSPTLQAIGARKFDVAIEGQLLLNDYDIYGNVGGYAGVVESFVVSADNNLDIDFAHVINNPMICAIEILRLTSGAAAMTLSTSALTSSADDTSASSSAKPSNSKSVQSASVVTTLAPSNPPSSSSNKGTKLSEARLLTPAAVDAVFRSLAYDHDRQPSPTKTFLQNLVRKKVERTPIAEKISLK